MYYGNMSIAVWHFSIEKGLSHQANVSFPCLILNCNTTPKFLWVLGGSFVVVDGFGDGIIPHG